MLLAQVDPSAGQVGTFSTFVVAIVTVLITAGASIGVAFIARGGDRRTDEGNRVPDTIRILRDEIADLRLQRDNARSDLREVRDQRDRLQDEFLKQLSVFADRIYGPDNWPK